MQKNYKGYQKTRITRIPDEEGKSIEENIREALIGGEGIDNTAPMIYTEKANEVQPEYDIRTDRFDLAIDATDKFAASQRASTDADTPHEENEQPKNE